MLVAAASAIPLVLPCKSHALNRSVRSRLSRARRQMKECRGARRLPTMILVHWLIGGLYLILFYRGYSPESQRADPLGFRTEVNRQSITIMQWLSLVENVSR
ncbi:hypothetical protein BDV24DRAFT_122633 [Aspergillus arachidicola]|uniref:Uncharacterized protein n=1 Tax=Aspergillus arachidicola TaxID=656916 RepID=A0A5N6YNB5_9EURO|nr:hypothetical protein BDV24DRAFT_122633 [Aspergillus arachidicola]